MKIVNEKMSHDIAFMTLSPGDVFFFPLERWYGIRLNDDNDHQDDNAVDLQTGELARLGNGDRVVLLKDAYLAI